MVSKYYIALRSQTNNRHAVHKEDCPFLPDAEKRICLGYFQSEQQAIREGEKHFRSTGHCRFCMKEHQEPMFSEIDISSILPTEKQLSQADTEAAFCYLN
jgi:hypothetical protein